MEDALARWPNLRSLLSEYLLRLTELLPARVAETWLYHAADSAKKRPEPATHFDALERAAALCEEEAAKALREKFKNTLPRDLDSLAKSHDARLLDSFVELSAYGWLRTRHSDADVEFIQPSAGDKVPDIRVKVSDIEIGVEAKNIHQSDEVRAAWEAGKMVAGHGGVSPAFVVKLKDTLSRARAQLDGYSAKMIFLNYTPDPDLWAAEEAESQAVEAAFRSAAPADCTVVEFRNYDWARPRFEFAASQPSA